MKMFLQCQRKESMSFALEILHHGWVQNNFAMNAIMGYY